MSRAASLLVWIVSGLVIIETTSRQLLRARAVSWLPEDPALLAWIVAGVLAVALAMRWLASRGQPRGTASRPVALILAAGFAAGLAVQLRLGARLQSDGFYYYAYLRSLAFDHDVNFQNDYRMLGLGDKTYLFEPTVTGHAHSAWTIGPSIVWSPFFYAGHLAASHLNSGGAPVSVDGTSFPYRQAICIAGLFYGLLGAWFSYRLTRRFFAPGTSGLSVALVIGGSFLLWYFLAEPTMTHAPSFAAVAGFLWLWAATVGRRRAFEWALLGGLAGLMALIRWQNAIFMIAPGLEAAGMLWRARGGGHPARWGTLLAGPAVFLAAAVFAFLPQMLAWRAIYGHFLAISPVGPQIHWFHPHLVDVLFSSRNGLMAMSPILYVAMVGAVGFAVRQRAIGVPLLVALALMVYFNSTINDWWGSDGYGARRFDGVIPILILGLATSFEWLRSLMSRRPALAAGGLVGGLIVWNLTFMAAAQHGVVRLGEITDFGRVSGEQARTLHDWIGHPFSYPVNLWFSLRNDVGPGEYDRLAPALFLGDPSRPYGRIDVGGPDPLLLGSGWYASERDGPVAFRWAGSTADLIVPLDHAADLDVQIRLRAFGYPGAPSQRVTMTIGGAALGDLPVPAEWSTVVVQTPAAAWREGVNRLHLTFAWAARPADVGQGGDTRELAAAVEYVRVQVRAGESR
jgi:hypothetical protein